jgi:hypothetical protein
MLFGSILKYKIEITRITKLSHCMPVAAANDTFSRIVPQLKEGAC